MKRLDVNLSSAQVNDLLFAMDIKTDESIKYFELTNALLTELRIMEEEEEEDEEERVEMQIKRRNGGGLRKNGNVREPAYEHKVESEPTPNKQNIQLYKDPQANISNSPQAVTTNPEIRAENALRRKLKAAAFRVGGVNWREVFRVFAQEKSKARRRGITVKDLCRGIRKDGKVTSSLFSDKNVADLFAAIDVDQDERASYRDFVHWMEGPRLKRENKSSARASNNPSNGNSPHITKLTDSIGETVAEHEHDPGEEC